MHDWPAEEGGEGRGKRSVNKHRKNDKLNIIDREMEYVQVETRQAAAPHLIDQGVEERNRKGVSERTAGQDCVSQVPKRSRKHIFKPFTLHSDREAFPRHRVVNFSEEARRTVNPYFVIKKKSKIFPTVNQ